MRFGCCGKQVATDDECWAFTEVLGDKRRQGVLSETIETDMWRQWERMFCQCPKFQPAEEAEAA
jgi:hypothetical protein